MSSINVFIVPKRSGIYYSFGIQLNVTREVTFPITLPHNIFNLTFYQCVGPILDTEMVTFNIGMEFDSK